MKLMVNTGVIRVGLSSRRGIIGNYSTNIRVLFQSSHRQTLITDLHIGLAIENGKESLYNQCHD